jgi:hypothetical protein
MGSFQVRRRSGVSWRRVVRSSARLRFHDWPLEVRASEGPIDIEACPRLRHRQLIVCCAARFGRTRPAPRRLPRVEQERSSIGWDPRHPSSCVLTSGASPRTARHASDHHQQASDAALPGRHRGCERKLDTILSNRADANCRGSVADGFLEGAIRACQIHRPAMSLTARREFFDRSENHRPSSARSRANNAAKSVVVG